MIYDYPEDFLAHHGVIPPTADIARKAAKAGRTGYDAVVNSGAMRRLMHEINIYNGRRAFNKQFG